MKTNNPIPQTTINTNTVTSTNSTNHNTATTGNIGYAPDAAWLAIRRHMQMSSFDDLFVRFLLFSNLY